MRTIAVINQKGGVGKTTTVASLGAAMAAVGRRVLLVDLDPQTHLTLSFNVEPSDNRPSIYGILTDGRAVDDVVLEVRKNTWLIASHINLAAAEVELVSVVGREVILRDALGAMQRDYDFVLIDCPPSLGLLTVNALTAAGEVFIPLQPHFLALQGVGKLFETVALVRDRLNPGLSVTGVVLCLHEVGTRLAAEVVDDLRRFLEEARGTGVPWTDARIFDTVIRRNIKLAECPSHGLTIFDYAPRSNGARDYARLAKEVLGELDAEAEPAAVPADERVAVSPDDGAQPPPDPNSPDIAVELRAEADDSEMIANIA